MRLLLSALVVLAMVGTAGAASIVLVQEGFEGGDVGDPVNTLPGWTGSDQWILSDTLVDSGQSATVGAGDTTYPQVNRLFSNTPAAGDTYTLTGTILGESSFVGVAVGDSGDRYNYQATVWHEFGTHTAFSLSTGDGDNPALFFTISQPATAMDFKIVTSETRTDFYQRENGTTTWNFVGGGDVGNALSIYDVVNLSGSKNSPGFADSILLTNTPIIPEPTTLALLVTGVIGLVGFCRRRSK